MLYGLLVVGCDGDEGLLVGTIGPDGGGGRGSWVDGSSVGKSGRRFSGLLAFSSSLLLMNSGHFRLTLAW